MANFNFCDFVYFVAIITLWIKEQKEIYFVLLVHYQLTIRCYWNSGATFEWFGNNMSNT